MIWSKDDRKGGGRPYHHGNLRDALVHAALKLIAEKGPGGFTFAEAARSAGVSPAAPYRHFRDRDELMAEIALRGFNHTEFQVDGQPELDLALFGGLNSHA
jgi:AcrR family transcriptional regulator